MTITYQSAVATGSFNGFAKLLFKWRGSIYKLVYKELIVFSLAYAAISFIYRSCLSDARRLDFERVSMFCAHYLESIPLSFVLAFYVTSIVTRWWNQFITIPFPDRLMNTVTMYVGGTDERGRLIRRTLMRYWNLSFVLLMSSISVAVKKRFPTTRHLVEAGFMTQEELHIYENVEVKINKFWIAHTWFIKLLDQARIEGRVREGVPIKHILEELNDSRNNLRILWCHDWVTVPLVYTQVVTWGVHLYFLITLIGRQYLDPTKKYPGQEVDLYVPFFTFIQFLFYMGWLKVAEQLINPFGEDDDDIECNWLIDRHLQVSYLGVDELNCKEPTLQKDIYWDDVQPEVPYTEATLVHKIPSYNGSTTNIIVPVKRQTLIRRRRAPAAKVQENGTPQATTPQPELTTIVDVTPPPIPPDLNSNQRGSKAFDFLFKKKRSPGGSSQTSLRNNQSLYSTSGDSSQQNEKNAQLAQRTLGRRETLMGDHILALINTGRWTAAPAIPPRPSSTYTANGSRDHLVIDVERQAAAPQRPVPNHLGRGSRKFGRFLQSRRSSSASQISTQSFRSISSVGSESEVTPTNGLELNNRFAFVNEGCTELDEREDAKLSNNFAEAQSLSPAPVVEPSTPEISGAHQVLFRFPGGQATSDTTNTSTPTLGLSRLSEVDEESSEIMSPPKIEEHTNELLNELLKPEMS